MAIKNYAVINTVNQLVILTTTCEEADVSTLYPGFTVVEQPEPLLGTRPVAPGMLYLNNDFWVNINNVAGRPDVNALSKLAFRQLFGNDELLKIDNFRTDASLSPENLAQLNTMDSWLSASFYIDKNSAVVQQLLNLWVSVGYITEAKKASLFQ